MFAPPIRLAPFLRQGRGTRRLLLHRTGAQASHRVALQRQHQREDRHELHRGGGEHHAHCTPSTVLSIAAIATGAVRAVEVVKTSANTNSLHANTITKIAAATMVLRRLQRLAQHRVGNAEACAQLALGRQLPAQWKLAAIRRSASMATGS